MFSTGNLYHSVEETYQVVNQDPLYFVRFSEAYCSMILDTCKAFMSPPVSATQIVKETLFDSIESLFISLEAQANSTGHPKSHADLWIYLQSLVSEASPQPEEMLKNVEHWTSQLRRKAFDATADILAGRDSWPDREAIDVFLYLKFSESYSGTDEL